MSAKIQYHKWPKNHPECDSGNCRAKRYYLDNGLSICSDGHVQQGVVQTQQDDEDRGTQGRVTRAPRESQEKTTRILSGKDATLLYLQAYQLILRKQCWALTHTIGLTAELEKGVKSLWGLRLQLFRHIADATSENAVFSSQPQTETEGDTEGEDVPTPKEYKVRGKAMPTLIEALGLCYMGCVLLSLPVSMGDLHRWAVREDIPFIRAVRFIPAVMKQRLPAQYFKALDTTSPLEPDHLRKTIHNLVLFYNHHFELILPPINASLLLFKHIRDLAVPITLHQAVMRIANLLSTDFTFPLPSHGQRSSSLPELNLASMLVIATKLYYPFHLPINAQHAYSLTDPTALALDWSTWIKAQESHQARTNGEDQLPRGSEINITEDDVMNMKGDQLDQYMDFYERTFIDETRAKTKTRPVHEHLLGMFPTGRPEGSSPTQYSYPEHAERERLSTDEALKTVVRSLSLRPIASEDTEKTVDRVGSHYKRYRKAEDLDETARIFHTKVAELLGIKLENLLVAVGQVERKLMAWRAAKVKRDLEKDREANDLEEDMARVVASASEESGDEMEEDDDNN